MDNEEDPLVVIGDEINTGQIYDLCLVGRVLTDSVVNFPSLKNTLADLWHLLRGVAISELEGKQILFKFYSDIDLNRVMDGKPWFFNRRLIIFHRLTGGEDPITVPLWDTAFRVQIHNLPIGFVTEGMARQFGDFIVVFLKYDASMVARGISKFMRIRVLINTRSLLKRKKRIAIGQNKSIYAFFQYERLSLFCFLCGRLGHGKSFCPIQLMLGNQQVEFGWDLSLRAPSKRGGQLKSKWLREKPEYDRWLSMEIDGEKRERKFGENITNIGERRSGLGIVGRFIRQNRNMLDARDHGMLRQLEENEDGFEIEEISVEFIDGKKRQRINLETGNSKNNKGVLELGIGRPGAQ
ncbi:hypothetical protein PVK06_022400 [Gossypium arboreum]|uniref:CCHC-type domain-containing protein n=1 Tax=Gossypium arboreum TaxID=29729 RepID=A0ABR0P899_GOSAR|nr:hypothetical protein PVK06_022400 [Gossypium arboreum]